MRTILSFLLAAGSWSLTMGQAPMKSFENAPYVAPRPLQTVQALQGGVSAGRIAAGLSRNQLHNLRSAHEAVERYQVLPSGSFWVDLRPNDLWQNRASVTEVIEKIVPPGRPSSPWTIAWTVVAEEKDERHVQHIRVQQTLAGHPVKGQDAILHLVEDRLVSLNGFAWTGSLPQKLPAPVSTQEALEAAQQNLLAQGVKFTPRTTFVALRIPEDTASLIWVPNSGQLILAYEVELHPNAIDHWTVYVNASTKEIMQAISQKCAFSPSTLFHFPSVNTATSEDEAHNQSSCLESALAAPVMDGATVTTDQDLLGANRTVNGYQVGANFFMIDASRLSMYQPNQSVMPNEPVGVIWTIDAKNSSPSQSNFEVVQVSNTNNNWKNLEVSAHFNAGQAFEYYRNTFNRNSINGNGGNIISIINVTDANDNDMDNAFWNGSAMFYGNGNFQFKELARGLDVAGHEMSHGVIQNTANLEYIGQSGALNESYADFFGALIDRDDWKIGEDVVNLSAFPSGALRDMQNPNNGGNQLGDPGWQPKHMNEFVNLPNTPENDNGGVHINSGIPNRAFFLLATSIGKDKAEQIYYKALRDYLVKSSQFVDMRLAAEKAATDLHGGASAELDAVRSAFNTVGIGGGTGGDYEDDIDVNPGDDFIIATDASQSDLYWIPPGNPSQFVKMNVPAPISRPSFTDDGASCVYVDIDHNLIVINFNWTNGLDYQAFYIEQNPQGIWRNIVVSKDGSRIAFTTSNLRNEINVFDFISGTEDTYTLFNPTTANGGINTGDVLYPDAMEWDYSGQHVMYDALNRIESNFGNGIEYWDISFLEAWNNAANTFGSGQISKLYNGLPENVSIGNPSFAKNSPYIITFDYLEDFFDNFGTLQTDYYVIAANIESGVANDIFHNTTVGYPSYSRLDDKILFTYDDNGNILLGTINVQPNDKTLPVANTDVVLINGAQKGVWFITGAREFNATNDQVAGTQVQVWPQPASDWIHVTDNSVDEQTDYRIVDMTGKIVKQGRFEPGNAISVRELLPGAYILQLGMVTGTVKTGRFVKQ